MRVVVSGATGFLGGALCRALHADGVATIGLGRNRAVGAQLEKDGVAFVAADLADPPSAELSHVLGGADAFVHAAALSSAWGPASSFERANVDGTRHALNLAERLCASRFVFISSPSVGFRFRDQPAQREDAALPPPVNAYAASKQQAERLVLARTTMSPIVLRPRAIYGRGDTSLLPRLLRAARDGPLPVMRGGRARTNLTHVDDVVAAVRAALVAPGRCGAHIYNIAGAEDLAVRGIIEAAAARHGETVRWRRLPWPLAYAAVRLAERAALATPGRPEPSVTAFGLGVLAFTQTLDISAARRDLGFSPAVAFHDGLDRTFGRDRAS